MLNGLIGGCKWQLDFVQYNLSRGGVQLILAHLFLFFLHPQHKGRLFVLVREALVGHCLVALNFVGALFWPDVSS